MAKDVAEALGIKWVGKKTLEGIPEEWMGVGYLPTPMRQRDDTYRFMENRLTLINTSGACKLAGRSKKPSAVAFTNWIYGEVVPSVLKTGQYVDKRRRARYQKQGKSLAWVEERTEGIDVRKDLTSIRAANQRVDASASSLPPLPPTRGPTRSASFWPMEMARSRVRRPRTP